jgi:hypothetical protein
MTGLDGGTIRIRVGIHAGQPALEPPNYLGIDVHRAARIMSSAHGGQVVLSRHTAELLDSSTELKNLGNHRFKDFDAPERIYQLGTAEHPPLRSLYRLTLPVPATPFLGREHEVAQVVSLLTHPDTRLLTLTGPGGTGKTRLAIHAASQANDHYPDGTTWVPLAPLRDPTLVLPTIAQALDLREQPGQPLADTLAQTLLGKQALLLLDNAEHLLPDAARELAALLQVCPTLNLLITSRERLAVTAETAWPVPPLDDLDGERLFLDRAHAAGVDLSLDETIRDLCRRLDQLPLAIELAAARTPVLVPAQLLERLGQRLDLLKGARDTDPRQRTLRATIDWSYELLDPEEQRVYRALSVFADGCTLDAQSTSRGQESTRSSRSSTRASFAAAPAEGRATGCWRRFASTPRNGSTRSAPQSRRDGHMRSVTSSSPSEIPIVSTARTALTGWSNSRRERTSGWRRHGGARSTTSTTNCVCFTLCVDSGTRAAPWAS